MKWKTVAGRTALVFIALLAALAVAELGLRLRDPYGRAQLGLLFGIEPESRYEGDPQLGYRPRDELYFRDNREDLPTEKPGNSARVFALGDSFTKAHGTIGIENSFYRQVESRMDAVDARNIEFLHFGVSGYCQKQSLELLRRYGNRYSPDYVLVQVYLGNDIGENNGLIERRLVVFKRGNMAGKKFIADVADNTRVVSTPRSYLLQLAKSRLALFRTRAVNKSRPRKKDKPQELDGINTGPHFISVMQKQPIPEIKSSWKKTGELITEIKQEAESLNASLLFILIPQELAVSDRAWEITADMRGLAPDDYDQSLPSERFATLLKERDIDCVDLTPAFKKAIDDGGDIYDGHFNRAGHDLATDLIVETMQKLGWSN